MSRKKNGSKKLFENMRVEPDEVQHELPSQENPPLTESAPAASESPAPEPQQLESESTTVSESDDLSSDALLEDMRRSLIEEQTEHDKQERPTWWQRLGIGSRKNTPEPESPSAPEEIILPGIEDRADSIQQTMPAAQIEEEPDPLDELIDMLGKEQAITRKPAVEEKPTPEPEPEPDLEELKKQAFQPRPVPLQDETEVRSVALEGDEDVFVEVQSTPQDPVEERLQAMENAFKPYRRYINFGLAFLGLVMAVIAAVVLYNIYQRTVVVPATEQAVSNLPYPISVGLPGGWMFNLGKGSLTADGRWAPQQAEWLQGTEVCRWVALPWSKQLEAVLRTLNPDDPIELEMSNNDKLVYKVYSIKQMSPEEMQKLDSNTPCLLVVLAEPDAEKRWVLTALP